MDTESMDSQNKHIDPAGILPKVFSGEASPEEKKLVDAWIHADPSNHAEFEAFAKLWNIASSASARGEIDVDEEWNKMNSVISPVRRKIYMMPWIQIAASVVVISALAFLGLKLSRPVSEKTPLTGVSTVHLPDGTLVTLNSGSKITYRRKFGAVHRNLTLKGEAFFEVVKGQQPFLVTAGEACIRVTGTKFNVKAYSGKAVVKVTVTEGTVILYESGLKQNETILKEGETGTFDKTRKSVHKQVTSDLNDLAWKTGFMDFKDTPLHEVVEILANTYHTTIDIDPAMKDCTVTVQFKDRDLESVMDVLKSTLDLTITRKGSHISISGKGC
jgi:ferric-dicitrate binding protein FerR (iron transport regulator)